MQLSIIIVNYKTPQLLLECLASVYTDTTGIDYEIIVVDNHSEDNSKELVTTQFSSVRWFGAGYNSGFARGNNLGIRHATGDHILLLNSDTIVKDGFIKKLYEKYVQLNADGSLGLLGSRIISSVDGGLLIGSVRGYWNLARILEANPIYILICRLLKISIEKTYNAYDMHYQDHEVDVVSGACVMLEMGKIKRHDLFLDEDFFLYFEDVEWSVRTKNLGYKNWFCADLEVYHVNAGSSKNNLFRDAQIQVSSYLFLRKTYGAFMYKICGLLYSFNYSLTGYLLRRKNITAEWQENRHRQHIFKNYFSYIFKAYKHRPSSNSQFLKYAEKTFREK